MGDRRLLIIGSQCEERGRLSFLPAVAQDLYEVMLDPELGQCVPALGDNGLFLDPSVNTARTAIETAFRQASENEATLFLAFIGHGEHSGNDFYLLPLDAHVPPSSHTAIHLVQLIKELHARHSDIDGLVVLIDACYSGMAATGASAKWVGELCGSLRFEVLTASADRPAADACFTRTLVDVIRNGIESMRSSYLRCEDVRNILMKRCPNQLPQMPSYNADQGLYLAKNVARSARSEAWVQTGVLADVERLTSWYQPTPQLERVVSAAKANRCVALVGHAGTGKSALAAALARPEVTQGKVPEGFVDAVAFISEGTSSHELARQLSEQLKNSLPDFSPVWEQYCRHATVAELAKLDLLQREVIGPLRWLQLDRPVRIVVDGLDRLPAGTNIAVQSALDALGSDPALPLMRLVVTSRPDTSVPVGAEKVEIGATEDKEIISYLRKRGIPSALWEAIVSKAQGNWLIVRLLADWACADPANDLEVLPPDLVGIYNAVLRHAGATDTERWRKELRPVLSVLAAAGVGPILPLQLLCAASKKLGGPSRKTRVRDVLVDLRGFVVRGDPGTDAEQVGVFHQTFAEYLLDPANRDFRIEPAEPHTALVEAIRELAPFETHNADDPLHRYAMAREADHLWAISEYELTVISLFFRSSAIPAENLKRCRSWYERIHALLGPDHPQARLACQAIASLTGQTGDAKEALRLYQSLLIDNERVLGPNHPLTFESRHAIAHWTGQMGNAQEALRLLKEMLPDHKGALGVNHPQTLGVRHDIARWTGEIGDAQEALRLFRELLPDWEGVHGPEHPYTLGARHNIAHLTGRMGNAHEAVRLLQMLLPDRERVLGRDHPDTLTNRQDLANYIAQAGDANEALRLSQELLPDMDRVLGLNHPQTLAVRNNIAILTGRTGDAQEAVRLLQMLLPDLERALGPNHPQTSNTRGQIRYWREQLK